jgi:apolipoprotein D and lipocalin family protein
MDDALYHCLIARFDALGFDSAKLRKVPQFPEQIGQPGFQ